MESPRKTTRCRAEYLLAYFGEEDRPLCGHCDNCVAGLAEAPVTAAAPYPPQTRVHHDEFGEGTVTGLRIRSTTDGAEQVLPVTGVFVAIGHDPRSDLFAGQLATDPDGYLLVDQPSTRTAIEGVFAAGDVVDRTYRQAVTAAGTGCAAALDAERWLAGQET